MPTLLQALMRRFRFALLLLFCLWPGMATAGEAARTELGWRGTTAEHAPEAARVAGGLELLQNLERSFPDGGSRDTPDGHHRPAPFGLGGSGLCAIESSARGDSDAVSPYCERLPYHATAPPLGK